MFASLLFAKYIAKAIPISMYSIVQATINTIGGGESGGFVNVAYNSIFLLVNKYEEKPITEGKIIKII